MVLRLLKFPILALILLTAALVHGQNLTLTDAFLSGDYRMQRGDQIRFQNTSSNFTRLLDDPAGGQLIELFDIKDDKKVSTILNTNDLSIDITIVDYAFSEDDKMLLLATETEQIFRYSSQSSYYIYNTENREMMELSSGGKQMYPHFSPDNSKVGFVRENDLFYKDLKSGKEVRISKDGSVNEVINGRSDWVYEEEFMMTRAYEWNENGSGLLYIRFDETEVPGLRSAALSSIILHDAVRFRLSLY